MPSWSCARPSTMPPCHPARAAPLALLCPPVTSPRRPPGGHGPRPYGGQGGRQRGNGVRVTKGTPSRPRHTLPTSPTPPPLRSPRVPLPAPYAFLTLLRPPTPPCPPRPLAYTLSPYQALLPCRKGVWGFFAPPLSAATSICLRFSVDNRRLRGHNAVMR